VLPTGILQAFGPRAGWTEPYRFFHPDRVGVGGEISASMRSVAVLSAMSEEGWEWSDRYQYEMNELVDWCGCL
jgi:hypothetical protein